MLISLEVRADVLSVVFLINTFSDWWMHLKIWSIIQSFVFTIFKITRKGRLLGILLFCREHVDALTFLFEESGWWCRKQINKDWGVPLQHQFAKTTMRAAKHAARAARAFKPSRAVVQTQRTASFHAVSSKLIHTSARPGRLVMIIWLPSNILDKSMHTWTMKAIRVFFQVKRSTSDHIGIYESTWLFLERILYSSEPLHLRTRATIASTYDCLFSFFFANQTMSLDFTIHFNVLFF